MKALILLAIASASIGCVEDPCGPAPRRPALSLYRFTPGTVTFLDEQWDPYVKWAFAITEWSNCMEGRPPSAASTTDDHTSP